MAFKRLHIVMPSFPILLCCWLVGITFSAVEPTHAGDVLTYSCSHQIYKAFEAEKIELFSRETGIQVEVFPVSSGSAVFRLMNGFSDIAGTARRLYQRQSTFEYVQIPFCKDPVAVIVHADFPMEALSEEQLRNIFSGKITTWKSIASLDVPVLVIVPDKGTAAYKNFHYQVMKFKSFKYDVSAQDATMVIGAVKKFPMGAISFISHGAAMHDGAVKSLKINGYAPQEASYPYYQTFYYITPHAPAGDVEKFIDFTFSAAGRHIIIKNGMLPIHPSRQNP